MHSSVAVSSDVHGVLRGNADRGLVALCRGDEIEIPDQITPWAAAQLSDAHVDLLARLPHPLVIPVEGFGPVVFCPWHSSSR